MEGYEIEKREEFHGGVVEAETARAVQEVQASLVIAKKFPRDQDAAYLRIMKSCERYSLADQAEYAYPRGGTTVSGPSIRLAEVIAQNWGNLSFGIRELSQSDGESEIEAFAWDLETNTRETKTFKVPHQRYTKSKGNVALFDPRDIYEHTANQGARRMRSCILGVVPGDIVDAAVSKCRETIKKGINEKPMTDQIRATLKAFDALGITKEMIERRLGHKTEAIVADELAEFRGIYRSIKDNITKREEWFDLKVEQEKKASDLTERFTRPPEDEKFICPHCGFEAQSERGLKKHITQSHSNPEPESTIPEPDKDDSSNFPPPASSTPTSGKNGSGETYFHCEELGQRKAVRYCLEKCLLAEKCQQHEEIVREHG